MASSYPSQQQLRVFEPSELARFDGVASEQIYISFLGMVYDVSSRPDLYGAELPGPYHVLAGRECARALSTMSLDPRDVGRQDTDDIGALVTKLAHALSAIEVREAVDKAQRDWQKKLDDNYTKVGCLRKAAPGKFRPAPAAVPAKGSVNPLQHHARLMPAPEKPLAPQAPPGPLELVSRKPRAYIQRRFLNPAECRSLINMILQRQERTRFEKKVRAPLEVDDPRWSKEQSGLIQSIESRLADLTGGPVHADEDALVGTLTPPDRAPADQGGTVADHLGLHVDTNAAHWRFCTAIIYLSSVAVDLTGGETIFPAALRLNHEGLPSEEEEVAMDAAGRLLELGLDHTDKALVQPELLGAKIAEGASAAKELLAAAKPGGPGLRVKPEEGTVCIFWTRQDDGEIDRFSWHGGAPLVFSSCGGNGGVMGRSSESMNWKWTLQKFKEVPVETRHSPAVLGHFVRKTRFHASKQCG